MRVIKEARSKEAMGEAVGDKQTQMINIIRKEYLVQQRPVVLAT